MLKYKNVVSTTFWFLRRLLKIEFVIWSRAKFRVSLQACQISRFTAQIVNERVKIVKSQVLVRGEKIRNFEFFYGNLPPLHSKLPLVSKHWSDASQVWVPVAHSLMSKLKCIKNAKKNSENVATYFYQCKSCKIRLNFHSLRIVWWSKLENWNGQKLLKS